VRGSAGDACIASKVPISCRPTYLAQQPTAPINQPSLLWSRAGSTYVCCPTISSCMLSRGTMPLSGPCSHCTHVLAFTLVHASTTHQAATCCPTTLVRCPGPSRHPKMSLLPGPSYLNYRSAESARFDGLLSCIHLAGSVSPSGLLLLVGVGSAQFVLFHPPLCSSCHISKMRMLSNACLLLHHATQCDAALCTPVPPVPQHVFPSLSVCER
jgi:hypothetical protein